MRSKGTPDVQALLRDFKPDGKKLTLAARITGPADTAFPDGPPKEAKPDDKDKKDAPAAQTPDEQPLPPQLKSAAQPIAVTVVADTDILEDRFWVQVQDFFGQRVTVPVANNGDFVSNAVDVLAGGNDLISLRSRGTSARQFDRVDGIQRAADDKYQATAKDLNDKLKDTEQRDQGYLRDQASHGVTQAASEEQTIENFRTDMIRTRQQLRPGSSSPSAGTSTASRRGSNSSISAPSRSSSGWRRFVIGFGADRAAQAPCPRRLERGARMTNKGLYSLVVLTLIAVIAAAVVSRGHGSTNDPYAGTHVLPDMAPRLDEVARVAFVHGVQRTTVARLGPEWVVEEKGSYPADPVKVRQALLGLAGLTLVEPKTSKADLYSRLEVEDADKEGREIDPHLASATPRNFAPRRDHRRGSARSTSSVAAMTASMCASPAARNPGSRAARSTSPATRSAWLDKKLLDVPAGEVKSVTLAAPGWPEARLHPRQARRGFRPHYAASRRQEDQGGQAAERSPPAPWPGSRKPWIIEPAKDVAVPKDGVATARYETFDGLVVTVTQFNLDGHDWARIDASGTGDAAKKAGDLEAKLEPWLFGLPSFKTKLCCRTKLDDVVEAPKPS